MSCSSCRPDVGRALSAQMHWLKLSPTPPRKPTCAVFLIASCCPNGPMLLMLGGSTGSRPMRGFLVSAAAALWDRSNVSGCGPSLIALDQHCRRVACSHARAFIARLRPTTWCEPISHLAPSSSMRHRILVLQSLFSSPRLHLAMLMHCFLQATLVSAFSSIHFRGRPWASTFEGALPHLRSAIEPLVR